MALILVLLTLLSPVITLGDNLACGKPPIKPNINTRNSFDRLIVGGNEAIPHSWPWQCYMLQGCGCSILSKRWLITAAHCIEHGKIYTVALGAHKTPTRTNKQGKRVKVQAFVYPNNWKVFRHREYNYLFDVALLKLKKPLKFSKNVQAVCLPKDDSSALETGAKTIVTGWGDKKDETTTEVLRQVVINIQDPNKCRVAYKVPFDAPITDNKYVPYTYIQSSMICASAPGKDSCQGDSGGPLVKFDENKNRWFLYGIVSYGNGCAKPNFPGVYVRVSPFCKWIEAVTDVNCH